MALKTQKIITTKTSDNPIDHQNLNFLLDFSLMTNSNNVSDAFDRQPDRRTGNRRDSAGRRQAKRYVLENDLVVTIELPGQTGISGDVLDLSLTAAVVGNGPQNRFQSLLDGGPRQLRNLRPVGVHGHQPTFQRKPRNPPAAKQTPAP